MPPSAEGALVLSSTVDTYINTSVGEPLRNALKDPRNGRVKESHLLHQVYKRTASSRVAIFVRRENPALQGRRESPHDTFRCSVAVLDADRRKTPKITPSQQGRTTTPLPDRSNGGVAPPAPRRCANVRFQLSEPRLVGSPAVYDGEEVTAPLSVSLRGWLGFMSVRLLWCVMLENLTTRCEAAGCDRPLDDDALMLALRTEAGERRAYECSCGAVTVTVVRP